MLSEPACDSFCGKFFSINLIDLEVVFDLGLVAICLMKRFACSLIMLRILAVFSNLVARLRSLTLFEASNCRSTFTGATAETNENCAEKTLVLLSFAIRLAYRLAIRYPVEMSSRLTFL